MRFQVIRPVTDLSLYTAHHHCQVGEIRWPRNIYSTAKWESSTAGQIFLKERCLKSVIYIYIHTYKHTVSRAICAISDTQVGDEACVQTWSNDSTKNINIAQLSITR